MSNGKACRALAMRRIDGDDDSVPAPTQLLLRPAVGVRRLDIAVLETRC